MVCFILDIATILIVRRENCTNNFRKCIQKVASSLTENIPPRSHEDPLLLVKFLPGGLFHEWALGSFLWLPACYIASSTARGEEPWRSYCSMPQVSPPLFSLDACLHSIYFHHFMVLPDEVIWRWNYAFFITLLTYESKLSNSKHILFDVTNMNSYCSNDNWKSSRCHFKLDSFLWKTNWLF